MHPLADYEDSTALLEEEIKTSTGKVFFNEFYIHNDQSIQSYNLQHLEKSINVLWLSHLPLSQYSMMKCPSSLFFLNVFPHCLTSELLFLLDLRFLRC